MYILSFFFIAALLWHLNESSPDTDVLSTLKGNGHNEEAEMLFNSHRVERATCLRKWVELDARCSVLERRFNESVPRDLYFDGRGGCRNITNAFMMSGEASQVYWPQIPHVAEYIFYFYSFVLAQASLLDVKEPCVYKLAMPDLQLDMLFNGSLLISDKINVAALPYVHHLLHSIHRILDVRFMVRKDDVLEGMDDTNRDLFSDEMNQFPNPYLGYHPEWFLHPADALQLGSAILDTNPCEWENEHASLLQSGLNILLIDRNESRTLGNRAEILEALSNYSIIDGGENVRISNCDHESNFHTRNIFPKLDDDNQSQVCIQHLEGAPFHKQVGLFREADILISVHGGGLTNIAFMKPCSIVIEIFLWGFGDRDYYKNLAVNTGLIYANWFEEFNSLNFTADRVFVDDDGHHYDCGQIIADLHREKPAATVPIPGPLINDEDENDLIEVNKECFRRKGCRECVKNPSVANITHIQELVQWKLRESMHQRQRCIAENPYYNTNRYTEGGGSYYPFDQRKDFIRDGLLLRSEMSGRSIYILDNGTKRMFSSGQAFVEMGFDFEDDPIEVVDNDYFMKIPEGPEI